MNRTAHFRANSGDATLEGTETYSIATLFHTRY